MLISKLCDRYEILLNLGSSGAVSTYIARDSYLPHHPQCVVKKIVSASSDPVSLKQVRVYFKREAELLEILGTHDQIPRLIDCFEDGGAFYLVQELVFGESLDQDEIAPGHLPWSEVDVIKFLQEMLGILQFVHEHQVIHGDIKPNSIIRRSQDGKLVLTDFDAIKLVQVPNQPISVPGTPGYMAPEQASGIHFASDIYALGITAIQVLTGIEPWHLSKDANGNITCPGTFRISDGLAAVLNKMVRSDYRERYQSAGQVLEALKKIPHVSQGPKRSKALVPKAPKKRTDKTRSPILKRLWTLALIPVIAGVVYGGFIIFRHQQALAKQHEVLEQIENYSAQNLFDDCIVLSNNFPGPQSSRYATDALNLGVECTQGKAQGRALDEIENYFTQGLFDDCIAVSNRFPAPQSSNYALAAFNLEAECLLGQAQQLADPPNTYYKDAIETAQGIFGMQVAGQSVDAAIVGNARQKIDNWSEEILKVASAHFNTFRQTQDSVHLREAVRILKAVPAGTAAHTEVEVRLEQWANEMLQTAKTLYNRSSRDADADKALELLRLVPEGTSASTEAQALFPQLKQHEGEMRTARQNANNALQEGECQTASKHVAQIQQSPYEAWKTEGQALYQAVSKCLTPLSVSDGYFTAHSSFETYPFKGFKDQQLRITMASDDFVTHLTLFDPNGQVLAQDHGDVGNRNSQLRYSLTQTGEYTIRAAAYDESLFDEFFNPNRRGGYTLRVTAQEL